MRWFVRTLLVLACLSAASCDQQKLADRMSPKAEVAVAKITLEDLRFGNVDAVKARLLSKAKNDPAIDAKLHELAGYFPTGAPLAIKAVGSQVFDVNGARHVALTYEYQFDHAWVLGAVGMVSAGDTIEVEGIKVYRERQSIEQSSRLDLKGKDAIHWLMLVLTCVGPAFSLFAFIVCLRTPMRGRKWLWAIFTLIGVGTLKFVWSTGTFTLSLLSVQLLSGSAVQMGYGPWVLGLSFPLGAVIFLLKRKALMHRAAVPPALPSGNESQVRDG